MKKLFSILGFILLFSLSVMGAKIGDNILRIGTKTGVNVELQLGEGRLIWDAGASKMKFSNDKGVSEEDIGGPAGPSGGASSTGVIYNPLAGEALIAGDIIFNKSEKILEVVEGNKFLEIDDLTNDEDITIDLGNYLVRDMGTDDVNHDLAKIIQDLINANVNLSGFSTSFSDITRTYTFSHASNFTIKCKTGSHGSDNTDDHICTLLGFDDSADLSGANTYTSAVPIDSTVTKKVFANKTDASLLFSATPHGVTSTTTAKRELVPILMNGTKSGLSLEAGDRFFTSTVPGEIIKEAETASLTNSQFVGFSSNGTDLVFNIAQGLVKSPNDWLATPLTLDLGDNLALGCQYFNSAGVGIRVFIQDPASTTSGVYIFQKKFPGTSWVTAVTSVTVGAGATTKPIEQNFGANFHWAPECKLSEGTNPVGVVALIRENATNAWETYVFNSTDLNNWAGVVLKTNATFDYTISGLDIRDGKAAIGSQHENNVDNIIHISDDSGSGFTSWGTSDTLTDPFEKLKTVSIKIQFFPAETGINKHRIVQLGNRASDSFNYAHYWKGDLTAETSIQILGTTATRMLSAITQDQLGNKNVISAWYQRDDDNNGGVINQAESNGDFNAGVLTFNNHGLQDINTSGSNTRLFNGHSSPGTSRIIKGVETRAIVLGNRYYYLVQTTSNPSSGIGTNLIRSNDMVGGSFQPQQAILKTVGNMQESFVQYISGDNSLMFGGKFNTDTLANNLVNGQMFVRSAEIINASNDLSFFPLVQIDGGKVMAGFLGLNIGSCWADGCASSFEVFNGSNDVLKSNFFQ